MARKAHSSKIAECKYNIAWHDTITVQHIRSQMRTCVVDHVQIFWVGFQQGNEIVGDHIALAKQHESLPVIVKVSTQKAVDVLQALCNRLT